MNKLEPCITAPVFQYDVWTPSWLCQVYITCSSLCYLEYWMLSRGDYPTDYRHGTWAWNDTCASGYMHALYALIRDKFMPIAQCITCVYIHTYIHTYMHVCIHAYIHTYIHTYMHTYLYVHTCIYTYIHTYIHTCIRTYIHTYMHTYICTYMQ